MKTKNFITTLFVVLGIFLFPSCIEDDYKEMPAPPNLTDAYWLVVENEIEVESDYEEVDALINKYFNFISDKEAIYKFDANNTFSIHFDEVKFNSHPKMINNISIEALESNPTYGTYNLYGGDGINFLFENNLLLLIYSLVNCEVHISNDYMTIKWDYKFTFNHNQNLVLEPILGRKTDIKFKKATITKIFKKVKNDNLV